MKLLNLENHLYQHETRNLISFKLKSHIKKFFFSFFDNLLHCIINKIQKALIISVWVSVNTAT